MPFSRMPPPTVRKLPIDALCPTARLCPTTQSSPICADACTFSAWPMSTLPATASAPAIATLPVGASTVNTSPPTSLSIASRVRSVVAPATSSVPPRLVFCPTARLLAIVAEPAAPTSPAFDSVNTTLGIDPVRDQLHRTPSSGLRNCRCSGTLHL